MGGGVQSYIRWLVPRLRECHKLLSPTGVFCLHLDYRSIHYAKVELDKIFGEKNFVNEVIWKSANKKNDTDKNKLPCQHNTILVYKKSELKKLDPYFEHDPEYVRKTYKFKDKKGLYASMPLSCKTQSGGYAKQKEFIFEGIKKRWMYSLKTLKTLKKEDRLIKTKTDIRKKVYLSDSKGRVLSSLWDDLPLYIGQKEKLGYPTQKPLELLDRLINIFTDKNDMVFDAFSGCGTTISSAQNLGRQWLGIDISKDAISVIRKRMVKEHGLKIQVIKTGSLSKDNILKLDPFEFERYVVGLIGQPNFKQRGDGGVDGYTYNHIPIQVKKSYKIGRPVLDSFYKHIEKRGAGIIIAHSFCSSLIEEKNRIENQKGWQIDLIETRDLIRDAS